MPTALFISPHLDDVAFSCGGTLARLSEEGWRTVLVTTFAESVPDPTGFALACQTDKGLSPEVDYMALRREEDEKFAARAGVEEVHHLDYPEAPHRGYESAPELFSGVREGDEIWKDLSDRLASLAERCRPEVTFVPQALGNHADHIQVVRAVLDQAGLLGSVLWYRDTPYAIRNPQARPSPLLPPDLTEVSVDISRHLDTKLTATAAYTTQLGFQFGGEPALRAALADFAETEARRTSHTGASESFLTAAPGKWSFSR